MIKHGRKSGRKTQIEGMNGSLTIKNFFNARRV
jgi:hypothetical protein